MTSSIRCSHYLALLLLLVGFTTGAYAQVTISPAGTVALSSSNAVILTASGGYSSYQWVFNNTTLIGGSSNTYRATAPGYYQVQATSGGTTTTSAAVRVIAGSTLPGNVDKNYTYEQNILQNGITSATSISSLTKSDQLIHYTDGFGRPIQDVNLQASPLQNDIISIHDYDAAGRESRSYLPYTIASDGQLRTNAIVEQQNFYIYTPKIATSSWGPAYSERVFEDSPLNRVLEQGGPGTAWQIQRDGNGNSTYQGHTARSRTRTNTSQVADKVAIWSYTPGASGTLGTANFTVAGAGTLQVQEDEDEDGRIAQTYTNTLGQMIGKRNLTQTTTNRNNPLTGYTYDAANRLLMVMTPEGMQRAVEDYEIVDAAFLERWAYFFEYDEQGRQSGIKSPGKAWMYQVYDPWNRLVATQNGNQRIGATSQWQWSYIKYDELNRAIITGTFYNSGSRADIANSILNDIASGNINRYETANVSTNISGAIIGYTIGNSFPKNPPSDLLATIQYYDSYDFIKNNSNLNYTQEAGTTGIASPTSASTRTIGRQTVSQVRILGSNQWLTTALYYDDKGRQIQSQSENHRHGLDRLSSQYDDATGNILITYLLHKVVDATSTTAGNDTHSVRYRYTYDQNGRPQALYTLFDGINGNTDEKLISVNEYNELSQLVDNKLGCFQQANASTGTTARYLQSVDYRYTLRGQLDKINDRGLTGTYRTTSWQLQGQQFWFDAQTPNEDSDAYADLFGLELQYDRNHTGSPVVNYNGNITSMMWNSRSPSNNILRGYSYEYNQLNQVTGAHYSAYAYNPATGSNDWNGEKNDAQGKGWFTTDGLSFDLNGNITSLNRVGHRYASSTSTTQFGPIDQLAYSHDGNKLIAVSDGIAYSFAPNDFEDGIQQNVEYDYDSNGNVIADRNKGITITYNELDLPSRITFGNHNSSTLDFIYLATGKKIAQILTAKTGPGDPTYPASSTKQTDYIAGFIYGQSDHLIFTTPTGRAILEPNRTQPDKWVQEYHLRDHQGSLRLAFRGGGMDLMASATMEPTASLQEEQQFDHIAETRYFDPTHARTGDYSTLLNAKQHGIGPSIKLNVKAGDSLSIKVFGRYDTNKALSVGDALLPTFTIDGENSNKNSFEKQANVQRGFRSRVTAGLTVALTGFVNLFHRAEANPRAYIRYNLFNKDSVLIKSAVKLMDSEANNSWQQLDLNVTAKEDGYITVALENLSSKNAYFDDLSITAAEDMIVQENHYDPFGQNLFDIETLGTPDAKNQYTGKERIGDLGLEWAYYGARMYDMQLGTWHSQDPDRQYNSPYLGLGNNPLNGNDSNGKYFGIDDLVAAVAGGTLNLVGAALAGKITSIEKGLVYFGVGAVGGWAALYSGPGGFALGGALNTAADAYYGEFKNMSTGNVILGASLSFISGGLSATGGASIAKSLMSARVAAKAAEIAAKDVTQRVGTVTPELVVNNFGTISGASAEEIAEAGGVSAVKLPGWKFGKIVGWANNQGVSNSVETLRVAHQLTQEQVTRMMAQGVTRQAVERYLMLYNEQIAEGMVIKNSQLLPRKALMEAILRLMP